MTDAIKGPWPESERRTPHIFGEETRIAADLSPSGLPQKELVCAVCGVVRVTVLGGGQEPRQWRLSLKGPQGPMETPACKSTDNLA